MDILLTPVFRLSVGANVQNFRLEQGFRIFEPTVTISPFGFVFVHGVVSTTRARLSLEVQKQLSFGNICFHIYSKSWDYSGEDHLAEGAEQFFPNVSVPVLVKTGVLRFFIPKVGLTRRRPSSKKEERSGFSRG